MQFNAVVQTERGGGRTLALARFTCLATVPEAYAVPGGGYVGLLIMHRVL